MPGEGWALLKLTDALRGRLRDLSASLCHLSVLLKSRSLVYNFSDLNSFLRCSVTWERYATCANINVTGVT